MKIAIDGPAGAGKSTISKSVAKMLNYIYIDTGAMYRSVGLAAIKAGLDTRSETELQRIINNISIETKNDEHGQKFFLNGKDVTKEIRKPEVSIAASNVATIPSVRLKLVDIQRKLAEKSSVVMDGRDIGTYVLPNAELKIFLTADVDERARRRYKELIEKKAETNFESVREEILFRDKNDSERDFAPLKQADDAVLLDTTNMSIDEVINKILSLVEEKCNDII